MKASDAIRNGLHLKGGHSGRGYGGAYYPGVGHTDQGGYGGAYYPSLGRHTAQPGDPALGPVHQRAHSLAASRGLGRGAKRQANRMPGRSGRAVAGAFGAELMDTPGLGRMAGYYGYSQGVFPPTCDCDAPCGFYGCFSSCDGPGQRQRWGAQYDPTSGRMCYKPCPGQVPPTRVPRPPVGVPVPTPPGIIPPPPPPGRPPPIIAHPVPIPPPPHVPVPTPGQLLPPTPIPPPPSVPGSPGSYQVPPHQQPFTITAYPIPPGCVAVDPDTHDCNQCAPGYVLSDYGCVPPQG